MIKFFKENMIFFTSSILLVGLFVSIPELRKISATNQISLDQISSTGTASITKPQAASSTISKSVATKPTTKKSTPTLSSVLNTHIKQRLRDEKDDD